ncbi:D-alanyl-D-alanine carboxypeptidase [Pleurocapsales cyanobacterium LEGE 10410]|nr:D-alanyl-D-alanine carboxypeptidase [Pleurocapsales cyanobacterium LEGE 10410]
MLDLIISGLIAWLNISPQASDRLKPLELFVWENSTVFDLPPSRDDLVTKTVVQAYLQGLSDLGIEPSRQGIYLQSGWETSSDNQSKIPLPAASLTKIATTLAVLAEYGAKHQFITDVYVTGEISQGIVKGDLIIRGSGDPLFVWEEAIALGNALNQLGIRQVQGNLLVNDEFYMNYQDQPLIAGKLLKQGLNQKLWQSEITRQYLQMPWGTLLPEVAIAGKVKSISEMPSTAKLLITHQSLPLVEILRQMNIYSNNHMAQILANSIGGAAEIAKSSAEIANFPRREIQLINGSGLGEANRISPRAVCQMLLAIDRLLREHSLGTADLFPTAGRDLVGTVKNRGLPTGTTVKTGTLDNVSALAGVIPTSDRGNVYFSIINYGRQVEYFRQQQDLLLNELVKTWQPVPHDFRSQKQNWYLGDPQRNRARINYYTNVYSVRENLKRSL